jgi:hypothetical protein
MAIDSAMGSTEDSDDAGVCNGPDIIPLYSNKMPEVCGLVQMDYALCMALERNTGVGAKTQRRWWLILLVLPYVGLLFPQWYARATPTLWGFPFFYWYQFAWVVLASVLMFVVYRKIER